MERSLKDIVVALLPLARTECIRYCREEWFNLDFATHASGSNMIKLRYILAILVWAIDGRGAMLLMFSLVIDSLFFLWAPDTRRSEVMTVGFSCDFCGNADPFTDPSETTRCGGLGRELALSLLAVTACSADPSTDLPISCWTKERNYVEKMRWRCKQKEWLSLIYVVPLVATSKLALVSVV